MKPLFTLLLLLAVQVTLANDTAILFVNQHAVGNSDGSSWEDAFTELEDALEQAWAGQQIWVAAGSYQPTRKTGGNTDFHYAFAMVKGVEIYGGFAGNENPENFHLNQRNFGLNETFLSGIIPSELKSMAPAVYHVIHNQNNNLDSTAVLDGFTISNGAAIGSGRDAKGGTGLPSAQMKELSTFTSWDFQRIWDIYAQENDGYPFLIAMGSPLPVNLIHFSAEPGDGIIEIHWVTASEINSERFTIEHSHDGNQWIAIGSVKAAGNSNDLVYYMFSDHNPYHGITYYRLIQTDFDGTTEVFGPVYAENRPKNMHAEPATLFPNPNNGNFTITVGYSSASLERGDYDIRVLSVTGKVVYSKTYKDLSFSENIGLELQDIPPGVYFVNICSTFEGPQSITFVKSQ